MMDKKRQTKLAQKSQSDEPAVTLMPSGVDTFDPVFVSCNVFIRFAQEWGFRDTYHCAVDRLRLVDDDSPDNTADKQ